MEVEGLGVNGYANQEPAIQSVGTVRRWAGTEAVTDRKRYFLPLDHGAALVHRQIHQHDFVGDFGDRRSLDHLPTGAPVRFVESRAELPVEPGVLSTPKFDLQSHGGTRAVSEVVVEVDDGVFWNAISRSRTALTVCHAISIAITVVLPAPVASLSASFKRPGLAWSFASCSRWTNCRSSGPAPGGYLGQPDHGLHRLDLTEEWTDVAELVVAPMVEQAGGLRCNPPLGARGSRRHSFTL